MRRLSRGPLGGWCLNSVLLFGVVRVGRIVTRRHQPLHVAVFVHDFAVFVGILVLRQIDGFLADWANIRGIHLTHLQEASGGGIGIAADTGA